MNKLVWVSHVDEAGDIMKARALVEERVPDIGRIATPMALSVLGASPLISYGVDSSRSDAPVRIRWYRKDRALGKRLLHGDGQRRPSWRHW
ncbi:hypothetical protein [Methylocystis sp. Sn-Cys]|uniref:hypothetical protein n=1 Tax=Methylocystis sp. Sn-Cys TaxID=1701263 RepID=UPI00192370AB|nr:hypothetical protein [Methylocystis sp. Sn-Cys]MBL1257827.1 hypothetical protein [Methylocystis sp. Sn-Cys]